MTSNFKVNINGTQTDTDDVFLLREDFPTLDNVPVGGLYVWGQNDWGQLGLNTAGGSDSSPATSRSSPVQLGNFSDWSFVQAGGGAGFAIVLKTDGSLWSWGIGTSGQLGHSDAVSFRSSPIQIGTSTNWKKISAGSSNVLAIKNDNTLWAWGSNSDGQLGLNDTVFRSSPVQVGTDTNWNSITSFANSCFAIKTDGTLWSWGSSFYGQLGLNGTISRSSPVQIGNGTNWKKVSCGQHVLAIKNDNTLWSWGYNLYGQLGGDSSVNSSSPVQVGNSSDWKNIDGAGDDTSLAIKTNGTLWAWGYNAYGQLGQNDRIHRSSPVQIGSLTNWKLIKNATFGSRAIKTDGTLWVWGEGANGQLGFNDANISRSSPVQLGTLTQWKDISVRARANITILY